MPRPSKNTPDTDRPDAPSDASQTELAEENRVRHAIIEAVLSHRLPPGTQLEDILRGLLARTTLTFALYYSLGSNVCSFDEHNHILEALESGHTDLACTLMDAHLHGVEVKLKRDSSPPEIDLVALFGPTP